MDENTWRFTQLLMWIVGVQTAFLSAILGVIWGKINHIEDRMIKIDEKVTDVDKRVFAIETMMHMKDCCMLKDDRSSSRKAE